MLVKKKMTGMLVLVFGGLLIGNAAQKTANSLEVKLSLGKPVQSGAVTLVPIESTVPLARDQYLTLAEATKMGLVEIVEIPGQEEVNSLEVRNKSKLPILLFAGELLLGGKQDRIVAKDSIIPAHERRDVPVFCVEHNRWEGKPVFKSGDTLVADSVRSVALASNNQSAVWAKVAESNRAVAAAPATGTIQGTLNNPRVKYASNQLFNGLNAKFKATQRTVGVICCINGTIESADLFANPNLFGQSKSKLFHSYALDGALVLKADFAPTDIKKCQAFLKQIVSAKRNASDRSKDGATFTISNSTIQGFESGTVQFEGGISAQKAKVAAPGGGGFGHGTYKPASSKTGG